jgi:hypothetical protein
MSADKCSKCSAIDAAIGPAVCAAHICSIWATFGATIDAANQRSQCAAIVPANHATKRATNLVAELATNATAVSATD